MFTAASVVVTSEQERPCLEEVNQNTTFLSIFTGRSQWRQTCTANNVETSKDDVSARKHHKKCTGKKRTPEFDLMQFITDKYL